jgi:hypothetical protein
MILSRELQVLLFCQQQAVFHVSTRSLDKNRQEREWRPFVFEDKMTLSDGKPCGRCGTSEWNKWHSCKECCRRRAAAWKLNNPDQKKSNDKRWQQENADKVNKKGRQWRQDNREKSRETSRIGGRKWRLNNPIQQLEASRKWKQANPDRVALIENNRRARKYGANDNYTIQEWNDLCAQYGNKCLSCGKTNIKLTADHIIPLAVGGNNSIANIQPLCQSCNSIKRTKTIDYRMEGICQIN